jgi:hypothetical protein
MHKEIISNIENAKKLYPIIFEILNDFCYDDMDSFDEKKMDSFWKRYKKLLIKLSGITGKDISTIDSYIGNDWETDFSKAEIQDISFRISLPEPKFIKNISQKEVNEICEIVKMENYRCIAKDIIERKFHRCLNDYFQRLLEINLEQIMKNYIN